MINADNKEKVIKIAGIVVLLLIVVGLFYFYASRERDIDFNRVSEQEQLKKYTTEADNCGTDIECFEYAAQQYRTFTIFFKEGTSEEYITDINQKIEANKKVSALRYTSAEDGLEDFKDEHRKDPLIMGALEKLTINPVQAETRVRVGDYKKRDDIIEFAKSLDKDGMIDHIVNLETRTS